MYVWSWLFQRDHIRSYMVEWEKPAPYTHMALSSNLSFSRVGRADVQKEWELCRSSGGTLSLDYDRCAKDKRGTKSGWSSVVLRSFPVLHKSDITKLLFSRYLS